MTHQDLTFSTVSRQETVIELLARLDVRPSPLEMVSVAILDDGIEISVNSEFVFYELLFCSSRVAFFRIDVVSDFEKPKEHCQTE